MWKCHGDKDFWWGVKLFSGVACRLYAWVCLTNRGPANVVYTGISGIAVPVLARFSQDAAKQY